MSDITKKFTQCVELKKQADALSPWEMGKKMELADKAINLSFSVMGGLIDKVAQLEKQVEELKP